MFRTARMLAAIIGCGLCFRPSPTTGAENRLQGPSLPQSKVIAIRNPTATQAFKPRADVVEGMVNQVITNLTRKATVAEAWASLVKTNDIVGLKVYTALGPDICTRKEVVTAVVKGLTSAGIGTNRIIIWDRTEADLQRAGYGKVGKELGVRVAGAMEAGYDTNTYYDTALPGRLVYGDTEFGNENAGAGRKSFVSKLVSREMTKIINVAPVLNHNRAGVAGNLFGLAMGSVDNTARFMGSPDRLAIAVPEIYALPALGERVILNISDALVCQYEGEDRSLLHYSAELNEIRMSHDPVALDVLALQDLERLRSGTGSGKLQANWELYRNGALLELGTAKPEKIDVITLRDGTRRKK